MHAKTLANIKVRAVFHMRDILRNVLPKFMEICMETPCDQPHGHRCRSGKPTETSVTEICYESVNRPFRLTQCCTQFKSTGVKIICVLYLHYNVVLTFNDMEDPETKRFIPKRFELDATLS